MEIDKTKPMKSQIIKNLKVISLSFVLILGSSCSHEVEQEISSSNDDFTFKLKGEAKAGVAPTGYTANNYFNKPSGLVTRNFTGTTSAQLQTLINNNKTNGAIIKIPKRTYNWSEIKLASKIQLEIEKGTIIKPSNNTVRRIFSIGTAGGGPRITDISIVGVGGKFTIDLSANANINKDMAVIKMGRVTNFKISNFNIKDRRTSLASILLNYIKSNSDNQPWPKDGVIEKINQTGISHTGYGLIQGYSASNVLFKTLNCKGGITLRLETDDKTMKNAVKDGGKQYGMENIYVDNIKCTAGLCAVMLSPHFTQNGKVNARNIRATGCAFAVRIEHGFVEVFDEKRAFNASQKTQFTNFIAGKITATGNKFVGSAYRRDNGSQWAIRLSDASVNGSLDSYITDQIGTLKNGKFANATFTNVTAIYKPTNAKLKQAFLKYIPCGQWSTKLKRPTDTGMGNGFEYYGPSMGLKFDNTDGSVGNGNYIITINGTTTGFSNVRNILYNTPTACSGNAFGTIPTTTSPGL